MRMSSARRRARQHRASSPSTTLRMHTGTEARRAPARTAGLPLDLTRAATVRAIARRVGLHTRRRLGQHFLIDREVLDIMVAALDASATDTVIEIGCGIGTLTGELATHAGRVVAIDVDPACVTATQITQRQRTNVEAVRADARQLDPTEFG